MDEWPRSIKRKLVSVVLRPSSDFILSLSSYRQDSNIDIVQKCRASVQALSIRRVERSKAVSEICLFLTILSADGEDIVCGYYAINA